MLKPMSFDVLEREVRKSTATDFIVELLGVLNGIQQSLRREVSHIKVHRKYTGADSTQAYWCFGKNGGEGGIRTHGTVPRTLAFEASTFNHSVTSPQWSEPLG